MEDAMKNTPNGAMIVAIKEALAKGGNAFVLIKGSPQWIRIETVAVTGDQYPMIKMTTEVSATLMVQFGSIRAIQIKP